jgi:hypothetical protein
MEKITMQVAVENNQEAGLGQDDKEIRLLQDLELVLVGGGSDPAVTW